MPSRFSIATLSLCVSLSVSNSFRLSRRHWSFRGIRSELFNDRVGSISVSSLPISLFLRRRTTSKSMAFEQYFSKEWKSTTAAEIEAENCKGCFDCCICLDLANEPVVTLCGHLYCWSCIYKWLHVQSLSLAIDEPPQCPVCKAEISHTAVVPLYGRGMPKIEDKGMAIPPRPAASNTYSLSSAPSRSTAQQLPYRNPYRDHNYYSSSDSSGPQPQLFSLGASGFQNPMVGMFGEMVYARVFGNTNSLFGYINPYNLSGGSTTPRLRRQEIQADKSLNRISIFLFCCFLLCLLVF